MNNLLLLTNSDGVFDPRSLGNLSYWLDASDLSTITQDTNGFSTLNNKSLQALNSPLEISGCQLWMDGADSSTVFQNSNGTTPSTNNTNVGYWADKSGNNRNFTQSSSGFAPTYITNIQNGRSVLRFSSSKEMTIASSTSTFNFLHNSTGTVYIVVKLNSTFELNNYIYLLSNAPNSASVGFDLFIDDRVSYPRHNLILSSVWYGSNGNSVSSRAIDSAIPSLSDYCIIRVSLNNNIQSNYRNIVAVDGVTQRQTLNTLSNNPSNSNASSNLKLGSANANTFEVAEIIIYSNQHTLEESTRVEKYLGSKWNIKSNYDSAESPLEIDGCSIWLDGADTSTFKQNSDGTVDVTSNNDRVGYWADKSGNGRHATQATGSIRPYFKSNSRNNKSGVYFDGTNYLDINYQTPSPDGEMFVVAQFPSDWLNPATGRRQILESRTNVTGGFELGAFTTGNSLLFIYDGSQRQITHTTGYRANGHHIVAAFFNSNSWGTALDGDSYTNGSTTITIGSANTTLRVGSPLVSGHQPWISDICEIIYFNKRLTSKNRKKIERYLSKKWNIDLSEEPAVNFGSGRGNSSSVSDDYTVSSIQSPNEISTCALWLDASDASSLKQSNNGTGDVSINGTNVRYWQDKSGNNRNATQALLASSPNYNTNAVNGRSALLFATDRFLDIGSFDITPSTIFLVYKQTTGNANAQTPLCLQESTGSNFANFICQSTGTVRVGYSVSGANNLYNTSSTAISGDTMIVSAMQVDSGTILNTHLNGIPLAESNVITAPDGNASKIGCRFRTSTNDQFFSGHLCEVIVYQSILNNSQRRSVEKYLSEKWGVNITTNYFPVSFWKNKAGDDGMMRVPGQTDGTRPIFNINTANRRSTIYFNQLNFLRSSLIAADWKYLSDGSVYTIFFVGKIGNTSRPNIIHTVLRTWGSSNVVTGMFLWVDARSTTNSGDGTWQFRVANGIGVNNGYKADCSLAGMPCNNWYLVSGIMNHNSALSPATNSLIAGTGYKSLMKVNDSVWITNSGHGGSAALNPVNPESSLNIGTLLDGSTSSSNLLGEVGEILIYKSILTPSQVQLVQNYLSDKWNVPLSTRTNSISSPKEISDCVLWLDASDSSTLKQNLDQTGDIEDGYPVCWWLDKSDNANHVFQKGPLLRPTYNINRIGSKPAVYFDGNDWLFSTTNKSSLSACTIFIVLRNYLSVSSISGIIQYTAGHSAASVGPGIYANGQSQYICDGNGAGASNTANTPYPRSGSSSWTFRNFTKLITAVYPTGAVSTLNAKIYIDGGLEEIHTNSASVATLSSNSRVQIGGRTTGDSTTTITRVFTGDIAEIIVYNRELSDSDRVRVEKYLSSKWGIT